MTEYTTSDNYPNPLNEEELAEVLKHPFTDDKPDAAEDIARVVNDICNGRGTFHKDKKLSALAWSWFKQSAGTTIVDCTAVYEGMIEEQKLGNAINYYEDHPSIAPPFKDALLAYQNGHGNIVVMDCHSKQTDGTKQWDVERRIRGELSEDPEVEWDRVRWTIEAMVWLGGQAHDGKRFTCHGPVHMWRLAVYENGEPADLSWVNLTPEYPMEMWDMAHATLLGSLNFLNCRNIEIVEPQRPRPLRRRIQRTGLVVSTINLMPIGKSSRSKTKAANEDPHAGARLTSVRGHFATYGPKYERGLLFGKYEGRFWIPQFARGNAEYGESRNDYKLNA